MQVLLEQAADGAQASVYSQIASAKAEDKWTLHATAQVRRAGARAGVAVDWASVEQGCTEAVDVERAYEDAAAIGLEYGPCFRGLRRLARGDGEALGEVELPDGVAGADRSVVHPALLDAAFHATFCLSEEGALALPFAIERWTVHQAGASAARVHVRRTGNAEGSSFAFDVTLADGEGRGIRKMQGLQARAVDAEALGQRGTKEP